MGKKQLVEPRTLKGFQDLLPDELIARKRVIAVIEAVFQRYGFLPVDTPSLEHLDVLLGTGGEETNKELFRLETPEEEPVALRFDLTVPFARLLAQYPDKLKPPFRRYAIGPVYRADKPGPGRFRQFTQLDVDIAGADSVSADAEIVAIMCEVMSALNVERYTATINNRQLVDALLLDAGIAEIDKQKHVLRVIDKLQKVGIENVRLEFGPGRIDESGDPIPGVHLDDKQIDRIVDFVEIRGGARKEVVDELEKTLPDTDHSNRAIAQMREIDAALTAMGVYDEHAPFDPSLARGLDYYTGPVFEMTLPDAPQFGSVMGGGRYNELVSRFLDHEIPCTGMSVGLDRLVSALTHLAVITPPATTTQVLVVTMGNVPKSETLRLAQELRNAGVNTEAYFAKKKKMKMSDQLSYADRFQIPVAVILGEDELAQGKVSIKNLHHGKAAREHIEDRDEYREAGKTGQVTVHRTAMISAVQELLQPPISSIKV